MTIEEIFSEMFKHNFKIKDIKEYTVCYPYAKFVNDKGRVAIINCDFNEVKMYYEDGNLFRFTIESIDDMNKHIFS